MKVTKRLVSTALAIVLVLIIAVAAGFVLRGRTAAARQASGSLNSYALSAPVPRDAQAAAAGVSAFYTIDYHEVADQWGSRLCKVLDSNADCQVAKTYLAPSVVATAQKYKIQTTCSAFPVRLVSDRMRNGQEFRIWEIEATISSPWPLMSSPSTVYAEVTLDPISQKWAMTHILFNDEVHALQTAMSQP
jgi:hypothetical protein